MATQDAFPFLDLPPEIRNEVYYLTLCERHDPTDPYGYTTCTALAPPAITRTNRQLRQETISFYYSHNRFVIHFPLFLYPSGSGSGSGGGDNDNDNGVQHHNRPASLTSSSFEHWCAAMSPNFRFLTQSLCFVHPDPHSSGPLGYSAAMLGLRPTHSFCLTLCSSSYSYSSSDEPWRGPRTTKQRRIGDDALDVHDPIAVQGACFVAMREQTSLRFWGVGRQQPFLNAIRALSTVAPLCTQINSRMYFSWDVPYDYPKDRQPWM
ncbi:hypothetical protein PGQ11_013534 [Apiospora arundinis]|uniref:Uncharacterized protein n=1 Tax=Apiospora arundinis TaxID=335852 RepID=A0ABR2HPN7_9PEZI